MSIKASKTKLQSPFEFDETWEELLENKEFVKVFLSDVLEDYICETAVVWRKSE